ncbi:MAG: OmpA family protein [Pseudomonadota bacterium]
MRLSTVVPLIVAFTGAAAGAYLAAGAAVGSLERASSDGVDFELRVQGHDWAGVQADGLQVVISGEAPSEADRFKVLSVAGTVVDAARIIDDMSVKDTQTLAAPNFSVEILRNDAGISLIGLMPAETDRERMLANIGRQTAGTAVTDLLEAADYPAPENWDIALRYGIDALLKLPRSKISVTPQRVEIIAAAENAQERDSLKAELSRSAPDGISAALRITAPRPVITPFTLRFLADADGARFDSCSADTQDALSRILGAAVEAGFEGKSECRLGLGTPTSKWGEAAAAGIDAIGALGGGSVTFSDTAVSLVAEMGTDQALFDQVSATLDAELPELFSLTAVLPEPEVESEEGPAGFVATLSPEGQVQMRGHLVGDLAIEAVETYAKSRFGAGQTYLAHEPHSALPKGWSLRTLAGLEALAELDFGAVEVSADTVRVSGDTGNQEARTRVAQILSEELGEGQVYSIDVTYREELDPLASIPTAEECITNVAELLAAKKLSFEPASADLDAESRQAVAAIAEVLRECPEFEIIIEGHTDSQGREVMNLNLSQSRAEAVVEALRNERIAWPTLTARGFGEAQPIADNSTEEGREANRRIEFRLVSAEEDVVEEAAVEGEAGE